ncbi:flagellar hook-associated protein 2 [Clostridium cavendishii DSM 21758]|uniref:Flagellar hook-associated protein 2 n=1 Tax=Clostridium cavendishii DSM 21758 TaxID=1121302 RepID=A0A1M6B1P3_9CLOT|nr:flagellar filament capping protein FliD [Clostridium cavendishii]SHI42664.1 flagellar hook-associated protein 2 [Clostridium cavendishii DSM 21758]
MISPIRVSGLSGSGIDTDTLVKQMMTPYKTKVDSVRQSRDLIKIQQDLYREAVKDFRGLYTKYFDLSSTANSSTNLILNSNYQTVNFSSSNENVVTARGVVGSNGGNYTIDVKQMASPETLNLSLDNLKNQKDVTLTFPTNQKDTNGNIINSTVNVDLSGKTSGSAILSAINTAITNYNKSDTNVNKIDMGISFSELGNCISIKGRNTGEANTVGFSVKVNDTVNNKVSTYPPNAVPSTETGFTYKKAQDALVRITDSSGNSNCNPGTYKNYSANIINIDGVEYTVNGESNGQPVTLNGKANTKNTIDNIKKFVVEYNDMIDKVSKKLTSKLNRKFKPLTDEQKKDMKDDDIKLWNEKVKEGQLRNDSILSSFREKCLDIFSTSENYSLGSLKDIGISLNPDYKNQKGQLVIDETKLSKALTENGDKVKTLLLDPNTGAFQKLKTTLYDTFMTSKAPILKKAGFEGTLYVADNDLSKKIKDKEDLIYNLEKDLSLREQSYYSKFALLEKAMSRMNSQQSWLAQSFK